MNLLISACLLGINCRYDGTGKLLDDIQQLKEKHHLIPICPEILGGLPTPRTPSERLDSKVVTKTGEDVTEEFLRGAQEVLKLARLFDCSYAVLKERSPSCGYGQIYDGSFTGRLIPGNGVLADLLSSHGITILGESQIKDLI